MRQLVLAGAVQASDTKLPPGAPVTAVGASGSERTGVAVAAVEYAPFASAFVAATRN